MTDEIQDWAKLAAYREAYPLDAATDKRVLNTWDGAGPVLKALARRIQRDDKPPVDPLLQKARGIVGVLHRTRGDVTWADVAENGAADHWRDVQAVYKYLKDEQNG